MADETGGRREAPSTSPILELRKVSKSFGAVQALYEVDFHVAPGEVMALVGDNGAGKSTLIKCIAGIHPIDEGEIVFDGEQVTIHGPKDAARLGIEVVYQDLALCDNLDVVENMYLGREAVDNLRRLADAGLGVVLISHNMNDVLQVSDRVAVLYLGRLAAEVKAKDVSNAQVVELITSGRSGSIGLQPAEAAATTI